MKLSFKTWVSLLMFLAAFFVRLALVPQVSAQETRCDGWASEGSEHRNAGNGCTYTCRGGNWSGPNRCDGKGNGQFQGAAARTEEERRKQEEAVRQRQQEAERKVQEQGAAATAAIAASTVQQRQTEAARQQAMVETARQAAIARGVPEADANRQAQEASRLVAAAQETQRGTQIVGSGDQRAAEIAARGYDPTSSLALTGNISQSTTAVVAAQNTAVNLINGGGACDPNTGSPNSVSPQGACCRGGVSECSVEGNGICISELDRVGTVGYCGQRGEADSSGFCGDGYCQARERGNPPTCQQDCANTNERGETLFKIQGNACVACSATDTSCVTYASCVRGTSTDPSVVDPAITNAQDRYIEAYRDCFFDNVDFTEGTLDASCARQLNSSRNALQSLDPTGVVRVQPIIAEERAVYTQTFAASQARESCEQYQNANDRNECIRAANEQAEQARREREAFCANHPERCQQVTNNANGYQEGLQEYYDERERLVAEARRDAAAARDRLVEQCASEARPDLCITNNLPQILDEYSQVTLLTGRDNSPWCASRPDLCRQARAERDAIVVSLETVYSGRFKKVGDTCTACRANEADSQCPFTDYQSCTSSSQEEQNAFVPSHRLPDGRCVECRTSGSVRICQFADDGCVGADIPVLSESELSCGALRQPICRTGQACNTTELEPRNGICYAREADPGETRPEDVVTYASPDICEQSGLRGCQYNGEWACVDPNEYPEVPESQDSSFGCQDWQTALQNVPVPERYAVFDTSGECVGPQDCRCPSGEIVSQGGYCDEAVTASILGTCASTGQTPDSSRNISCCEGLERITSRDGERTETTCQSPLELRAVEQDFAAAPVLCTDENGCECRNIDARPIAHVGQGVACPTEDRRSDWPQCSGETVPYGTNFSNACLIGEGWAGQCQQGFAADGDRCAPQTISARITDLRCRFLPFFPGCPQNPNGQILEAGQSCPEGAQCFCVSGSRMDGNTCRNIEQVVVGGECADPNFCQCQDGKLVGNRCLPNEENNACFAFQGTERCIDGYRYNCRISVYPLGTLLSTGEQCGDERACVSYQTQCEEGGRSFRICSEDGTRWITGNNCADGFICLPERGRCVDNRPFEITTNGQQNQCNLTSAREYAVNLPQCGNNNYICQYGPARLIQGRYVCPDPNGSFSHGCPDGMYWEALASECRYRPDAESGVESFAGYQCTQIQGSGITRQFCQACGRAGQPACTNCYADGQLTQNCSTTLPEFATESPQGQTNQQVVNSAFNFSCNAATNQCQQCGGNTGRDCPLLGFEQDSALNLVVDCEQLRIQYPQEYNRLCSTSVTGGSCQFVSLADQANSPVLPELRQPYFICTTQAACNEAMANPPLSTVGYGECRVQ